MKKLTGLSTFVLCIFFSVASNAQPCIQANGEAPIFPVYPCTDQVYLSPYPSYYDPRHRRHDFEYWQQKYRNEHHEHESANHR